jgi:hypothetical protein
LAAGALAAALALGRAGAEEAAVGVRFFLLTGDGSTGGGELGVGAEAGGVAEAAGFWAGREGAAVCGEWAVGWVDFAAGGAEAEVSGDESGAVAGDEAAAGSEWIEEAAAAADAVALGGAGGAGGSRRGRKVREIAVRGAGSKSAGWEAR